ncbi:MAG TPA: YidC/Oxa1 family membrane protein insertase [Gaiellaceae bacterium]|jgi:YidC/Oxa1 family membrane protein insertase|nr:YidC/Oxa1 family membrane protein insertase [Gaiellaceae bacterium]
MIVSTIPIFSQLEDVMKHVLNFFHSNIGLPWAWSIVATTIVVRVILVPLTIRQIHSMQALQKHAPQMKEIQKKYKQDRQKQNEELMKFYRENNINPAASCLPMLLQLPVFIALYYTLKHFQTNFHVGKHTDLSFLHFIPSIQAHTTTHWGGYVLLVVYVASQMASSFFMMTTTDKMQRTLFMVMPLFFVFIIARFPAGLVLYWVTTNLWTVGQGLITRRLVAKTPAPALERRSSRTPPKDDGSSGNGAKSEAPSPKPAPSASQRPRQVRRKKKRTSRR